jgi:DNA-binding winged helix-turn-helix (wHTH) protein
MTSAAASGALTQFEHFAIDASRGAVLRDGETITLRPQSFRVLQYLVANPDRLISKEELFERIWGEAVVTDDSLAQCLVDIRRALGDEGRQAVRTLPRRGYLFSARAMDAPAAVPPPASADGSGGMRGAWLALAVLGLLALPLASWVLLRPAPDSVDTPAASSPVVAVLPFADFTPAGDRDYLALGLPEEIINSLTQVNGLRVISRTSSFLPQLGQQLTAREIGAQLGRHAPPRGQYSRTRRAPADHGTADRNGQRPPCLVRDARSQVRRYPARAEPGRQRCCAPVPADGDGAGRA